MLQILTHAVARWKMKEYPELHSYLEANTTPYRLGGDWSECEFLVVDTETTGLNYRKDSILSIGAIRTTADTIYLEDSLALSIEQESQGDAEAIPVHGILPGEGDIGEKEALLAFLHLLGGKVLVAHHAAFDSGILEQRLRAWFPGFRLLNRIADTVSLARMVNREEALGNSKGTGYSLDDLALQYDIRTSDRHTADGDAYITSILLLKLLHRLKTFRIESLRSLVE